MTATAVLYARVSTQEQAQRGFSLRQQIEALRAHAGAEGFEVLEEVEDPGQSGASLERPGLDRVRDLVSGGGVSVVLAQDRDRFAREPAFLYLLKTEFAESGTRLRALNDRSDDDTAEGELTSGILDQLAKFERAKTAERSRRGKLAKARRGLIVGAAPRPTFGFAFTETRDAYVVNGAEMQVVREIFRMVGEEGVSLHGVEAALVHGGVPAPNGGRRWSRTTIRNIVQDDCYRGHDNEEIAALVAEGLMLPDVAARLDPGERYGVWWFNRRRNAVKQVAETGPNGRSYRRTYKVTPKPRAEWIAVPVVDAGIPPEVVGAAREVVENNPRKSSAGGRFWQLGGVFVCGGCGNRMVPNRRRTHSGAAYHLYYRCQSRQVKGIEACPQRRSYRAEEVEEAVWGGMVRLLCDPGEMLREFDKLIERERTRGMRGGPEREVQAWATRLEVLDRRRVGYLDLAADGIMSREELRGKLAELDDERKIAEGEIASTRDRDKHIRELEEWRDSLWMWWSDAPNVMGLENATPEERNALYRRYRIEVVVDPDGTTSLTGPLVQRSDVCSHETTH